MSRMVMRTRQCYVILTLLSRIILYVFFSISTAQFKSSAAQYTHACMRRYTCIQAIHMCVSVKHNVRNVCTSQHFRHIHLDTAFRFSIREYKIWRSYKQRQTDELKEKIVKCEHFKRVFPPFTQQSANLRVWGGDRLDSTSVRLFRLNLRSERKALCTITRNGVNGCCCS